MKKELCINERIQNPVKHLAGSDILIEILEKQHISFDRSSNTGTLI